MINTAEIELHDSDTQSRHHNIAKSHVVITVPLMAVVDSIFLVFSKLSRVMIL